VTLDRRRFLLGGLATVAVASGYPLLRGAFDDVPDTDGGSDGSTLAALGELGELGDVDDNGLRLLPGATSRIVATTGLLVPGTDHEWHLAPDGGTCIARGDGGWMYVSNSEVDDGEGGVSAIEFERDGSISGAHRVLSGSSRNCAGGGTPWRTWLSCEEHETGVVWECDPLGRAPARRLAALGRFAHEAAAVDLARACVYLTEDEDDGGFYRFAAARGGSGRLDLDHGTLEVAEVIGTASSAGPAKVIWHPVPDPGADDEPTRAQVGTSTSFPGGEGAWFFDDHVIWTTKGDARVYDYDVRRESLSVIYDGDADPGAPLRGVDNVAVGPHGRIVVAEDGDDMQLCVLGRDVGERPRPIVQVPGHDGSEMTGPAFSPDGRRLYFSSQRGEGGRGVGVTYEVTLPASLRF